jgi:c-di-GMP-binding flagellar brake protein YcgR
MKERRRAERVSVKLDARWEGAVSKQKGTVTDISETGCFMLTADNVTRGEPVSIEIKLTSSRAIFMRGEVVYQIPEMGFAVQFTDSDETEKQMLKKYLDFVRQRSGPERAEQSDPTASS